MSPHDYLAPINTVSSHRDEMPWNSVAHPPRGRLGCVQDTLLLPLLRLLHESRSLPVNSLYYMILILLLMLSQDAGFVSACQSLMLPSVPWFKDRLLGKITVGSLFVLVLVRAVQTNLAGAHDSYCLLIRICPQFLSISPLNTGRMWLMKDHGATDHTWHRRDVRTGMCTQTVSLRLPTSRRSYGGCTRMLRAASFRLSTFSPANTSGASAGATPRLRARPSGPRTPRPCPSPIVAPAARMATRC